MPYLLISAAHKSSGKTTVTLGICAALARRGVRVQSFKKGPDYIDPMWLGLASGRPCYNLDFNTQSDDEIADTFRRYGVTDTDVSIIEGNMGLYDSLDVEGRHSNAALAAALDAPVVLLLDVKGMTRTVVPIILGLQHFEPRIRLGGIILNKVAGRRHEQRLREAIAHYTDVPVLGVVHRDAGMAIDERHLGLVPSNEEQQARTLLWHIADRIEAQVDLDALLRVAASAPQQAPVTHARPAPSEQALRIAIARDKAFGFYYPDDLEQFSAAGVELIPFDTLQDPHLPEADGLFIGGGFPETQMAALAANTTMRESIANAIDRGMPAYAECGGLMYLTRGIQWGEQRYPMCGVLQADTVMHERPVGRGYTRLRETPHLPWPAFGDSMADHGINAHEFHYSSLENLAPGLRYAYQVERGAGIDGCHDGIVHKNLVASYAHLRNVETVPWVQRFVAFVRQCQRTGQQIQ